MNRSGSTLIELTILLAILTLLASIAIPTLHRRRQFEVLTQAHHLCAIIRQHQQYALMGSIDTEIKLEPAHGSYTASASRHALPHTVKFGAPNGALGPPSAPTHPIRKAVTFNRNCIRFFKNGTIDSGTIYLTDSSKTLFYAITIGVATVPYIRIYRYHRRWKSVT